MSNAVLWRGGTPVLQFPQCDGSSRFQMPPPDRVAAEYGHNDYTLGMPLKPSLMVHQDNELAAAKLAVGDFLELLIVPSEHIVNSIFVAVDGVDTQIAGAAVTLSALVYDREAKTYTELPDVAAAATAQGVTNIVLDTPSVQFVSLAKVTDGYAVPLFVEPKTSVILALKVASLPTDTTVDLSMMQNSVRYVAKVGGFDAPTQL